MFTHKLIQLLIVTVMMCIVSSGLTQTAYCQLSKYSNKEPNILELRFIAKALVKGTGAIRENKNDSLQLSAVHKLIDEQKYQLGAKDNIIEMKDIIISHLETYIDENAPKWWQSGYMITAYVIIAFVTGTWIASP